MRIRDFSKADALHLLELINSSKSCADVDSFKNLLNKMKKLISHDYCAAELAKIEPHQTVETSCLVNVDFPWEYMIMYQRDNWRRKDPIQKDAIGAPRARYLSEIFKKNNPPKWMHAAAWDFKIKDGYAQAVWNKLPLQTIFHISGIVPAIHPDSGPFRRRKCR